MASKGKSILVIDDDIDLRKLLRKLLENQGHVVYEADNIGHGLEVIREKVPHLILLDISLGDENGLTLFSKLGEIDPYRYIKVVMISSHSKEKVIRKSMQLGASSYIVKPINNAQIVSMLKKMLPTTELPNKIFSVRKNEQVLQCVFMGQVTKINELGLNIRSKVKFEDKQKIQVHSDFLKSLKLDHVNFLINKKSFSVEPGIYDSEIRLIGLRESDLVEIRKLKTRKV